MPAAPPPASGLERRLAAERAWPWLLACLAVATALLLVPGVAQLASPLSGNYSEGWNAYWAEAARLGQPLYAAPPGRTVANYPPLSFHLVALLARIGGSDVLLAGRLLGLFCLGWSAVNLGVAATGVTGSRGAGVLAGLLLLLWVALLVPGRIGTDDPHFLGLALATLGLCTFVAAGHRSAGIAAAAALFATALFVKQSLLGFPAGTALFLLLGRRWAAFGLFAAVGLLAAAAWLALVLAVDGSSVAAHLLSPRSFDRQAGIASATRFGAAMDTPLLVACAGLLWRRDGRAAYLGCCLGCAALLAFFFAFGNGVADNNYLETLAALAVAAAVAVDAVRRGAATVARGAIPAIAAVALVAAPTLVREPEQLYGALGRAGRLPQRVADHAAAVALLRATPGPALCESLLLCWQAGKPFVFDAYYVKDQIAIGRIAEAAIVADLDAKRFAVVEIGEDDAAFSLEAGARLRFTAATVDALLRNYRVALRGAGFAVLLPR